MMGQYSKIVAAGFCTTFVTSYIHALMVTLFGFSPFGFSLYMIIPVGALFCGFAAMSGFVRTATRFDEIKRPHLNIIAAMYCASFFGLFLIYFLEYAGAFIPGRSLWPIMSFWDYLSYTLLNADIVMRGRSFAGESGGEIALLSFTQIVGFLIVPAVAYRSLPSDRSFLED